MTNDNTAESGDQKTQVESSVDSNVEVRYSPEELTKKLVDASAENKKHKLMNRELQQKNQEIARTLAEIQEKKDIEEKKTLELFQSEKAKRLELEKQLGSTKAKYGMKAIMAQLANEANKAGCLHTDYFAKMALVDGMLEDIEPDEDFNVSQAEMQTIIEKAQLKMPFMFGKQAPAVKDGTPKNTEVKTDSNSSLSLEQKIQKLAEIDSGRIESAMARGDRRGIRNLTN